MDFPCYIRGGILADIDTAVSNTMQKAPPPVTYLAQSRVHDPFSVPS